ncbi:MAG: 4-hydroxy-3-methylbut-2-enyl diphosphate reductase, partial [Bacteroidales bacterium]|nr:4-hydroxy-3-methylbut-2-enyl diphosphate reductase [Bacteroidales bacterium]
NTFLISSHKEIDKRWFEGINSIGICGATSTPKWLLEKVYTSIKEITSTN